MTKTDLLIDYINKAYPDMYFTIIHDNEWFNEVEKSYGFQRYFFSYRLKELQDEIISIICKPFIKILDKITEALK